MWIGAPNGSTDRVSVQVVNDKIIKLAGIYAKNLTILCMSISKANNVPTTCFYKIKRDQIINLEGLWFWLRFFAQTSDWATFFIEGIRVIVWNSTYKRYPRKAN